MRKVLPSLLMLLAGIPLLAQPAPPVRRRPPQVPPPQALSAESALKQATVQLTEEKKVYERDLAVLSHLRDAERALTDPSQPNNAVQKAFDEVAAAESLATDFAVRAGIIRVKETLDDARRSPPSADFGRLRASLQTDGIDRAARLVAANGVRLNDEIRAWLRVQDLLTMHLTVLSEISGESLRAAQQ